MPQESQESLLHVPLEDEAQADLEDSMVKDVDRLKVVPLLLMKVQILSPTKSAFLCFDKQYCYLLHEAYESARLWVLNDFITFWTFISFLALSDP
ncbi:UNVERIFIED_CONTAM: hypothetical protein Sradi_5838600 [Sesamum radiatum]|uniref:Uncharacterized protein n=1 Tax=Sesamum radiatum TaxID=300843 RepID=A0AAW2KTT6_SESRA